MSSDRPPLHQMNPLERFSDRAQDYANFRPSYPPEVIQLLLEGLGSPEHVRVADVGAGTGIASRLLADQGVQVWAVEPNAEMRQAAQFHPRVTWLAGSAEVTHLPNASVDLVTCFQAFHWFDPLRCLPELRRILKPTGRLVVVWNNRDRSDPLTQGYSAIVQRLSNHHPAEQRINVIDPLLTSMEFKDVRQYTFPYRQALDLASLVGRAQSVSYIPKDPQTQQQLLADLQALYQQWADPKGLVYMAYSTEVFLAQPANL